LGLLYLLVNGRNTITARHGGGKRTYRGSDEPPGWNAKGAEIAISEAFQADISDRYEVGTTRLKQFTTRDARKRSL